MSTPLDTRPEWAAVIAEHAAEDATARRLIAQLVARRGRGARVLPAARALGARRGRPVARRAAARRRCGAPPTASRRRSPGSSSRSAATCSSSRPTSAEGRSWFGEPSARGARRLGAGARPRRRAGRARTASPPPTSSSRCSCARSRASPSAVRWQSTIDAGSLWAGLFDLRENLLGRALDDLRALAA